MKTHLKKRFIGEQLRKAIDNKGTTISQLSNATKKSRTIIYKYLNNEKAPSDATLKEFSIFFNLPKEYFTNDLYGNTLIVIDAQKEFVDEEDVYLGTVQWLDQHKLDYDSIIFTNFTNKPESMFVKHLGYSECMEGGSLIFDDSEFPLNCWVLSKTSYGLPFDVSAVMSKDSDVTIVGCELDACVMAICFQLWDAGIDFKLLTDYCWTNNEEVERDTIIQLLKRQFGDCIY